MAGPVAFRADSWVKAATGQAITGAHAYWCTQPVSLPQLESAGVPNQAINFTDSTGATTAPQPLITDAFGHADGYFAAGLYTLAIYVNGQLQQVYADQALVGGGLTSLNGLIGGISLVSSGSLQFTTVGQNIILSMTQGFPSALIADTLRLNVLNDNAWDAVNYASLMTGIVGCTSNNLAAIGIDQFQTVQLSTSQTTGIVYPTATSFAACSATHGSAASTNTIVGFAGPVNNTGSTSLQCFLGFYRLSFKVGVTLNPSCRYWIGLGCIGGSLGNNATGVLANTNYAADVPNKTTLAFRYSPGTDTTWKAVSISAGASASSTVVDTGIAPVNNTPQIFEIVPNLAGTSVSFYINYVNVATISTNLPPNTGNADSLATIFCTGDNKNTANAPGITFYYGLMSYKGAQVGA